MDRTVLVQDIRVIVAKRTGKIGVVVVVGVSIIEKWSPSFHND